MDKEIIVFGGSAGSISVLTSILPQFPSSFKIPIVVVVHRAASNKSYLEEILRANCMMECSEIEDKMPLKNGKIYIAPGGYHLLIEKEKIFSLDLSEKINYARPNIDLTFSCISEVFKDKVIGILLTGSNDDGAEGLKLINKEGGTTIVQSPESSEMKTMPNEAIKRFKPDAILKPGEIFDYLVKYS